MIGREAFVTSPLPLSFHVTNPGLCGHRLQRRVTSSSPSKQRPPPREHFNVIVNASLNIPVSDSPIRLMACDIDGTLLTTDKRISSTNVSTISRLMDETDVIFVPATGKSRAGALKSMGSYLSSKLLSRHPAGCPGVYLQGLLVFTLDGTLIHESTVPTSLVSACAQLANDLQVELIAYSRDRVLCERTSPLTDLLPLYHEPDPEVIDSWEEFAQSAPLNKMIFMAEPARIDEIRPAVQKRVGDEGTLTQAQGNMLEVLPKGASKGDGVRRLLKSVDVEPKEVLAIGDAENDIELLKMVGYSCVVGNALPSAKAVAKFKDFDSNDEDGVSQAILQFLLPASVRS